MSTKKNKFNLSELSIQSFVTSNGTKAAQSLQGGKKSVIIDESGYHTCRSHFVMDCAPQSQLICTTQINP